MEDSSILGAVQLCEMIGEEYDALEAESGGHHLAKFALCDMAVDTIDNMERWEGEQKDSLRAYWDTKRVKLLPALLPNAFFIMASDLQEEKEE